MRTLHIRKGTMQEIAEYVRGITITPDDIRRIREQPVPQGDYRPSPPPKKKSDRGPKIDEKALARIKARLENPRPYDEVMAEEHADWDLLHK